MMRVGIDATSLPPRPVGAGHYIIQLVRAFARGEREAEFVVFTHHGRVELLDVPETPWLRLLPVTDMRPAVRLLWEQTVLPGLAMRQRLDVLHSLHYSMPLAYPGRRVVTLHDMTFFLFPELHTLPKRYFFRFFIRTSSRLANALVADSESTRRDAIRLVGTPPEKIHTAQLGVTPEFQPRHDMQQLDRVRLKYQLPERYILYVGLIEPRKNLPSLLQAFASVASSLPDHTLVIVGRKGWSFAEVWQLVEALGITGRVLFTGYVEQADLPLVYNMAEMSVYPSVYEGFGLPVLEAMASGTPVITSNVSSMPEIVGEAGVLLPPRDTPALAQAILRLAEQPAERQRLSELGLIQAGHFTWDRTADETMKVYQLALEGAA